MQGKRWCFTHHDPYLEDHFKHMFDKSEAGGFGYEVCPTTGKKHMQGWVSFPSNQRLNALKELCNTCHWEVMKGTEEQSQKYCEKEGFYFPWGRDPSGVKQGQRRDIEEAVEAFENEGKKKACVDYPAAMAKYHKGIEYVVANRKDEYKPEPLHELREWQGKLAHTLFSKPNDRTIYWVRDTLGGKGKSAMVRHLICTRGAVQLEGKVADMAFMYNSEPIVCFDVTRAQAEVSDHLYSFAEKLKNGSVISTKYETKAKHFAPPHVVFFANKDCPAGVFSADRIELIDLD